MTNPNAANLTLPAPGSAGSLGGTKSIVIDTTAPTVTGVTSTTANGSYGVGSVITITVGWSKPVVVTGTPQLALNSGGTASYSSGSGTSTLTFTYTVAAGQNSPSSTTPAPRALSAQRRHDLRHGDQPQRRQSHPAGARLGRVARRQQVDRHRHHGADGHRASLPPRQTALTGSEQPSRSRGLERAGGRHRHTATGPELRRHGKLQQRQRHQHLTFTYTVAAGENSPKLDYTSTTALSLNGGTIFDTVTNPNAANLTLPAPGSAGSIGGTKSIVIDTTATSVTGVSSTTASGAYGVGSSISITVGFNNAVVVTGTPQLALNSGGTASYSSGSGTSTLTFTYTVAAGQNANPLDEASTSALTLNGGTINNASTGVPALLTLPAPGTANSLSQSNIVIDTTAPTVTGVTSTTANGSIRGRLGHHHHRGLERARRRHRHSATGAQLRRHGQLQQRQRHQHARRSPTPSPPARTAPSSITPAPRRLSLNGGTIFDTVTNPNAANLTLAGAWLGRVDRRQQVDRHRHHGADRDGRDLDDCRRHLRHRGDDRDHRRLEQARGRHRDSATGTQLRRHGQLQQRQRHQHADVHLHRRRR